MEKKYILTHDLGTSGNKAALFDLNLNCIGQAKKDYPIYYPKPGWAEQNPEDFWQAVKETTHAIIEKTKIKPEDILALSFSCQMNCTIPINKDGNPIMNVISWLDTRGAESFAKYNKGFPKVSGYPLFLIAMFIRITGGGPGHNGKDPSSHMLWLKENDPDAYNTTYKFLSVKDYIIYRLTGNCIISRDLAHTSWLMDTRLGKFQWSDKIIDKFGYDKSKLPDIKNATELGGSLTKNAANELGLKENTPIISGAGDLVSSAIGSGFINDNKVIACLGTAAWVGAHVSKRTLNIKRYIGAITSVRNNYLCISKQETGAVCHDWVIDQMYKDKISEYDGKNEKLYQYIDDLIIKRNPGSSKLIFTPWMLGERSPINDPDVRGGFYNLSLSHTRDDMARAVYEGVALNLKWSLVFLEKMIGKCSEISLIGGGAISDTWCQIIADVLDRKINQMVSPSLASTKGAAICAMVGLKILNSFLDAIPLIKTKKIFTPNKSNREIYNKLFFEYEGIYERNKEMFQNLNRT